MSITVIPPYVINNKKAEHSNQIQLEIPDYSAEYAEWMRRKQQEEQSKQEETVIVIDIY